MGAYNYAKKTKKYSMIFFSTRKHLGNNQMHDYMYNVHESLYLSCEFHGPRTSGSEPREKQTWPNNENVLNPKQFSFYSHTRELIEKLASVPTSWSLREFFSTVSANLWITFGFQRCFSWFPFMNKISFLYYM